MTHSERRKLDQQFIEAFGRTSDGRSRYRWMLTSELVVPVHSDRSSGGIWYVQPKCDRINLREIYGDVWIVAVFRDESAATDPNPIVSFQKSKASYGKYTPIDGSTLQRNMEPDADVTAAAIWFIGKHIEKSYRDHLDEANAIAGKAQDVIKREWSDKVDDAWPAFGNAPGMKAHVSFPAVQKGHDESNDSVNLPA